MSTYTQGQQPAPTTTQPVPSTTYGHQASTTTYGQQAPSTTQGQAGSTTQGQEKLGRGPQVQVSKQQVKDKAGDIKRGGGKGAIGLDQVDWGEHGGKIYECWKCEPCCGSPCNAKDALICCCTWYWCGLCAGSKLYASSMDQTCACVPHVLFTCFCGFCAGWFTRYNLRQKHAIDGNLLGDFICVLCCGCCAGCQHLRASAIDDWALIPFNFVAAAPEIKLIL